MGVINKKIRRIIIFAVAIILLLVGISIGFTIPKILMNLSVKVDKVNIKDKVDKKEMMAVMVFDDTTKNYVPYSGNTFPMYAEFNSEKSGCIDINGQKIANSLTYTNNKVVVNTNKTSYCYVYFDPIDGTNTLINKNEMWQFDGGYRYYGTNPNNHICFGTNNKGTCTGNSDQYMYRIIGVFKDSSGVQHMKLIKKEALNSNYRWNSSEFTDKDWKDSTLYKSLNNKCSGASGCTDNIFLNSTNYNYMKDSNWTNKIYFWNWSSVNTRGYQYYATSGNTKYGIDYMYSSPITIFHSEHNSTSKIPNNVKCYYDASTEAECNSGVYTEVQAKIGLMDASDYALSLGQSAANMTQSTKAARDTLKTGWMHITNNDTGNPGGSYEWTISRYGQYSNGDYDAYFVSLNGDVIYNYVSKTYSVRPVFYLESSVKITAGDGTIGNPYLIG